MLNFKLLLLFTIFSYLTNSGLHGSEPPTTANPTDESKKVTAAPVQVPEADLKAIVEGNNKFAIELFKKLAETEKGNVLISPYSISSALSMTYAGARGNTAEEMSKVLGLGALGQKAHDTQHAMAGKLIRALNSDGQEFRSCNSLWLRKGSPFEPSFLKIAKSSYDAHSAELDFDSPSAAAKIINQWVSKETQGKIGSLLNPRDLPKETQLVLANATVFKGLWLNPFDKSKTVDDVFYEAQNRTIDIKMMQNKFTTYAWDGDGIKAVSIPFRSNSSSMLIIMPDKEDINALVIDQLTSKLIENWIANSWKVDLTLRLPRRSVRQKHDLNASLTLLGINQVNPDFSGISPNQIGISKIIHEAMVDFDELGAEAVAATAVVGVKPKSLKTKVNEITLNVNRPFCFVIYDKSSGLILYVGRILTL